MYSEAHFAEDELDLTRHLIVFSLFRSVSKALQGEFNLDSGLAGTYQTENIRTGGCAIQVLIKHGRWTQGFIAGIKNVVRTPGCMADGNVIRKPTDHL